MARIFRLLIFVAVLASLGLIAAGWAASRFYGPGPSEAAQTLVIPRGSGAAKIASLLANAGIIRESWMFVAASHLLGVSSRLRAGEFAFPARVSGKEAMDIIVEGETVVRRLTVPEGQTVAQIIAFLHATEGLEGDPGPSPGEGELLPETYHFSYGDSRKEIVDRMKQAMRTALAQQWESRAPGLPLSSPAAAVTLASIVEKETGRPDERARIAGVFYNRLKRGMRLQSDPTVIYGVTRGETVLDRALTRADLDAANPYNTYQIAGLPPGPIANPGLAALTAVMHPAETEDLYFVADGTGGHAFARTLAEHNRNVARWQQFLNQQRANPSGAGAEPAGR